MLRIIPRLDIKNSYLVKGINLEGLRSLGSPEIFAKKYYQDGADEIFYINIVSSLFDTNDVSKFLKNFSKEIFLPITVGGGIQKLEQIQNYLELGADRVYINSGFVKNKKFAVAASKEFGRSNIVGGVEVLKIDENYFVTTNSGRDISKIDLKDWINYLQENSCGELVITSVNSEGLKSGFDLKLIEIINKIIKVPFTLHGGFSNENHILKALAISEKISGISIASHFHYNAINFIDFNKKEQNHEIFFLSKQKKSRTEGKFNCISELKKN